MEDRKDGYIELKFKYPTKTNQLIEEMRRSKDVVATFVEQPQGFREYFLDNFFDNLIEGSAIKKNFSKSYIFLEGRVNKIIEHAFSDVYSIVHQTRRLSSGRSLEKLVPNNPLNVSLDTSHDGLTSYILKRSIHLVEKAAEVYQIRKQASSLNKEQYIQGLQLSDQYQAIYMYIIKLLITQKDQDKREMIQEIQEHIVASWRELVEIMIDNFIAKVHYRQEQDQKLQYKNLDPKSKYYHIIEYGKSEINTQPVYDYIASAIDGDDFMSISDITDKEEFIRQIILSIISGELDESFSNINHSAIDINLWRRDDLSEIGEKCKTIHNNVGVVKLYLSDGKTIKASYKKANDDAGTIPTE